MPRIDGLRPYDSYVMPTYDWQQCRPQTRHDPVLMGTQYTLQVPTYPCNVRTPDGRVVRVEMPTLTCIVSDNLRPYTHFAKDPYVNTHAKVNGGKMNFSAVARQTIDGYTAAITVGGVEVYALPETDFATAADAEKAAVRLFSLAVKKLLSS